jgi:hypothetical protein
MESVSTQYGLALAAVVIALWIVRELLRMLRAPKKDALLEKILVVLTDIQGKTNDLHEWHSKTDAEGVKIWYVRRSLEGAIGELSKNVGHQTDIFQAILSNLALMSQKLNGLSRTKT